MRFVLWSGCHRVSQGVSPTHYDTDINKSEALWFSRPGKVSWLKSWNNSTMEWDVTMMKTMPATALHCHMLQVLKQGLLSSNPAAFSTFQTNLQRSQLCWYWDTILGLQPSITSSCRLSNNLNHNQNIQKSTQSADRTVDMFLGLLMLRLWQNECREFQSEGCGLLVSHQEILAGY